MHASRHPRGIAVTTAVLRAWLAALILAAGCATSASPAKMPVTNFHQVAGAWTSISESAVRAKLVIQTNGRYWMTLDNDAAFHGQLRLEGGALRYDLGPTGAWRGTATLVDAGGKEHLRFVHDTGQFWMECERGP